MARTSAALASTPAADAPDRRLASALHRDIPAWYRSNARVLPWRDGRTDPWGVLVSEVMLQQTPVARVEPVWREWMRLFPDPARLAAASPAETVRAWGRLGYPRRALRLRSSAEAIVAGHGGRVPSAYPDLLALPGVGAYTAAAVASFAFGQRQTVVDTNIRRVFARAVLGAAQPSAALTAAETRLAASLVPRAHAKAVEWNVAVMELGALVCTARSPLCGECPVRNRCRWQLDGAPEPEPGGRPAPQAWHGSDRQLRGAVMAVLRSPGGPVAERLFLGTSRAHDAEEALLAAEQAEALAVLRHLGAGEPRMARILAGLLADGLAARGPGGISLPE